MPGMPPQYSEMKNGVLVKNTPDTVTYNGVTGVGFDLRSPLTDSYTLNTFYAHDPNVFLLTGTGNDYISALGNTGMTFIDPGIGNDQIWMSSSNTTLNIDPRNSLTGWGSVNDIVQNFSHSDTIILNNPFSLTMSADGTGGTMLTAQGAAIGAVYKVDLKNVAFSDFSITPVSADKLVLTHV
jgi:hypothetical protein